MLARSFNAAAARIEELVGAHRALLANASHELRSPLARLRLALDLQAEAPSEARRIEIIRNLEEIDALIEEILLASRLDRPEVTIGAETVDLAAILREEARGQPLDLIEPAMLTGDARCCAGSSATSSRTHCGTARPRSSSASAVRAIHWFSSSATTGRASILNGGSGFSSRSFARPAGRKALAAGGSASRLCARSPAGMPGMSPVRRRRAAGARFVLRLPAIRT